jgi:hypothetical protein
LSKKNIAGLLSAATATLLSQSLQAELIDNTSVDATAAVYIEENGIQLNEDIINLRKEIDESNSVDLQISYDVMTGSSPIGAIADNTSHTVTSPSGSIITIDANETPSVPYDDQRLALSLSWEHNIDAKLKNNAAINYAVETDYQSIGFGEQISLEFNQRLSTVSLGVNISYDSILPKNGIPQGLSNTDTADTYNSDDKLISQVSLSLSHILNRRTLLVFTLGAVRQEGYLTDPYKRISFIDSSIDQHHLTTPYFYERRPESRQGESIAADLLHQFSGDKLSLKLHYEFYQDDWAIDAHTVQLKWRYEFNNRHSFEPELRLYTQEQASFYHYYLANGLRDDIAARDVTDDPTILDFASADHRLGALNSRSIGLAYAWPLQLDGKIKIRAVYIEQNDKSNRFDTLKAALFQASLHWKF